MLAWLGIYCARTGRGVTRKYNIIIVPRVDKHNPAYLLLIAVADLGGGRGGANEPPFEADNSDFAIKVFYYD